jgi:hypothetical protein
MPKASQVYRKDKERRLHDPKRVAQLKRKMCNLTCEM